MAKFNSTSLEATDKLGAALAKKLEPGTVVSLHGPLGAGKTALSRAIARSLGITEPVTSPTFALVMEYSRPDGSKLFHLDMYRIDNEDDAVAFGVEEYLFQNNAVTLVEWPERIDGLLTPPLNNEKKLVRIELEHAGDDQRTITMPDWIAPKK